MRRVLPVVTFGCVALLLLLTLRIEFCDIISLLVVLGVYRLCLAFGGADFSQGEVDLPDAVRRFVQIRWLYIGCYAICALAGVLLLELSPFPMSLASIPFFAACWFFGYLYRAMSADSGR